MVRWVDAVCDRADHSCYLITKVPQETCPLETYLAQRGTMTASQIRIVLDQVLETLQFLHNACWIRFPLPGSEQLIKGIPHGNINLGSLSIRVLESQHSGMEDQFFIYVTDLALWEHLFLPPGIDNLYSSGTASLLNQKALKNLKFRDLRHLCQVVCHLAGANFNSDGIPLELADETPWEALGDPMLWAYLRRLWNAEELSAEVALEELRSLPEPDDATEETQPIESQLEEKGEDFWSPSRLLLFLSVAGIFATAGFYWKNQPSNRSVAPLASSQPVQPVAHTTTLDGAIEYQTEAGTAWGSALQKLLDQANSESDHSQSSESLQALLGTIELFGQSDFQQPEDLKGFSASESRASQKLAKSYSEIANYIRSGDIDIGLVKSSSLGSSVAASGLKFEPVAYDGLAVFVPFGNPYRSRHSVGKLGHTIGIPELRQLYTGDSDTPTFRGQPIKLYFPDDAVAIDLFKALVLNQNLVLIERFDRLHRAAQVRDRGRYPIAGADENNEPDIRNDIYEKMLYEFESEGVVSLGFDQLGAMFNQCSVYPLAVKANDPGGGRQDRRIEPIQPLRLDGGEPIHPTTDLCNAKGSYWVEVSEAYPLAVELGLLFPSQSPQGEALTHLLRTTDGQYLLSEAGLVPQMSMEHVWHELWGGR
ncbi:hypothetical protein IQ254_29575 [Nodosilinea sp. LEGE 07088]|uniref:hypothetical protein n=1 Tax=Nodosilinea sp. LEGE 07088 TaxID=2777968 RepID=UPI0018811E3A|nr:hypothetical protein [Nodosilinea sp. LEGE 07088]MBE9141293.1 hypothetical protein [Nodosilinea sp. LEGE 07088]